jgi:rhodanese-related sulfurtransferase
VAAVPDLLIQHGVAVLFAWAFAVQAGVPAPAVPMLLGAGVLSGSGQMELALAVAAAMAATVGAHVLWYSLGRSHGTRALGILCRFSLDPDSLIRHAKERFAAHRLRYLVHQADDLRAEITQNDPCSGPEQGAGRSVEEEAIGTYRDCAAALPPPSPEGSHAPSGAQATAGRRRPPGDRRLEDRAGHRDDVVRNPRSPLDQLIPKDSEVVFYCAEPREATSARMALLLTSHGYKNVHPLNGGLEGWRQAGFIVESLRAEGGPRAVTTR